MRRAVKYPEGSVVVSVRLPLALARRLESAVSHGKSRNDLLQEMVQNFLSDRGKK